MAKPPGCTGQQGKGTPSPARDAAPLHGQECHCHKEQGHPAGDGGTQPNVQPALAEGLEARTSHPAPSRPAPGVHGDSQHPSTQSLLRI